MLFFFNSDGGKEKQDKNKWSPQAVLFHCVLFIVVFGGGGKGLKKKKRWGGEKA